jgi:Tol biopolymer transport system component
MLPAGLDGRMVITELNPEQQIVLVSFDGSQRQVLVSGNARGALTQDGTRLAYVGDQGIMLLDMTTRSTSLFTNRSGYDLHWSPDGTHLSFVNPGDQPGIWVIGSNGSGQRRLSDLSFETIAGWSPDGTRLYYAAPDSGGNGWQFKAVGVSTGEVEDLFILENASLKAPMPALSPDGEWIAYRAGDNSSLYLVRIGGTDQRLVLDQPTTAISGFAWERQGHLLAISLLTPENPDGVIIQMQIDPCEAYILPGLHGVVEGILIP